MQMECKTVRSAAISEVKPGQDIYSELWAPVEYSRAMGSMSASTQFTESGITGGQGGEVGFWRTGFYQ